LPLHQIDDPHDLIVRQELVLVCRDEAETNNPLTINQEQRWAGDVPGRQPELMPDAITLHDVARLVDEDVERQPRLLDVALDLVGLLGDDGDDLNAPRGICRTVQRQFTEPAAAVRSPRSSMEGEQHRTLCEIVGQGAAHTALGRKDEVGSGSAGLRRVSSGGRHENSLTSTSSPFSATSVCAGISMYPSASAMLVMSPEALKAGIAAPSTIRTV
jgi:hypothetical protein